ncbi:nitrogen fixation protein [Psychrobacter sp. PL15]|nr:nitrogen fixation protein [Psychrobacter sp. PL15]
MSLCQMHKNIEDEVIDFNAHVQSAGEESITDYLFWRWSLANRSTSHFTAKTFTKIEENKITGADFEMEIWFIGDNYSLPLAIQAKKISNEHKAYRSAFSYPDDTKQQINTLLNYAKQNKRVPLYMLYSKSAMCTYSKTPDCGIYIANALDIERFSDLPKGTKLPKTSILNKCIHFYQLFCASNQNDLTGEDSIQTVISTLRELLAEKSAFTEAVIKQVEDCKTEILPNYVRLILDSDQQKLNIDEELVQIIQKMSKSYGEIEPRKIVVIDARQKDRQDFIEI